LTGTKKEMDDLVASGQYFTVPLFNFVEGPGQTDYHIIGIARVRLMDFKMTGAEKKRFIDFLVEPGFVPGVPGGSGSGTGGNKVISICAVDATNTSGCLP